MFLKDRTTIEHAVADGRVECSDSSEPDFYIDGIPCCDHIAARALTRTGLIPADDDSPGRRAVHLPADGEDVLDATVNNAGAAVTNRAALRTGTAPAPGEGPSASPSPSRIPATPASPTPAMAS